MCFNRILYKIWTEAWKRVITLGKHGIFIPTFTSSKTYTHAHKVLRFCKAKAIEPLLYLSNCYMLLHFLLWWFFVWFPLPKREKKILDVIDFDLSSSSFSSPHLLHSCRENNLGIKVTRYICFGDKENPPKNQFRFRRKICQIS